MKKLYGLLLSVMLIFSVVSVSMASEFYSYIGGHGYFYATNIDGDRGLNPAPGVDCFSVTVGGVEKVSNEWGDSYAGIKYIFDTWNNTIYHYFGINNILGSKWHMGFDAHDTGICNTGQQFMGDLFNDFKADTYFNTANMGGSISVQYLSDTFELRTESHVYDHTGCTTNDTVKYGDSKGESGWGPFKEGYAATLVFKSKDGKSNIHVGGQHFNDWGDDSFYVIGAAYQLNELTNIKVDYWSDKGGRRKPGEFVKALWNNGGSQTVQATIEFDKITGEIMCTQPEDSSLDDSYGLGGAYKFTERLTAGFKYFDCTETAISKDGEFYDVYGDYNIGAWGVKFGTSNAQFAFGHNGQNNSGSLPDSYSRQASQSADPFIYLGMHFQF